MRSDRRIHGGGDHSTAVWRCSLLTLALPLAAMLASCGDAISDNTQAATLSSCMRCHNGSHQNDYAGPGIEDPHPFGAAANLACTTCHGGHGDGNDKAGSHVPPPPQIGDRDYQLRNREAFFNRLTLTGIDKYPDYQANGRTYTALDYLQFINPGDLRVVNQGKACGQCHQPHADIVSQSLLATEAGVLSGATFAIGQNNHIPAHTNLFEKTAADLAFRAVTDQDFVLDVNSVGAIGTLLEFPVYSARNANGRETSYRNDQVTSANLVNDVEADGRVKSDTWLARLMHEQFSFTCGDCHLGSAGANNRYGDFRSSGCTACHMPYSLDGRSRSRDPNVDKNEPLDPDDLDPPERAHVRAHRIVSVFKTRPNGVQMQGMDDHTCAGCHQGSNRTVMQYWGIRLDQNQDLRRRVQYPANPVTWRNSRNNTLLFDPVVGNRTFNGRNANQYVEFEDYDGDGRDDTPADVHHEAGMGCIDCHGSHDLHGGTVGDVSQQKMYSRMSQAVSIRCESCHGSASAYATTKSGTDYAGNAATLATDAKGNVLRHVARDANGHYWLTSKLTGRRHYVKQTLDTIVNNGRTHPTTNQAIYSAKASYAMGRADGNSATGIGAAADRQGQQRLLPQRQHELRVVPQLVDQHLHGVPPRRRIQHG